MGYSLSNSFSLSTDSGSAGTISLVVLHYSVQFAKIQMLLCERLCCLFVCSRGQHAISLFFYRNRNCQKTWWLLCLNLWRVRCELLSVVTGVQKPHKKASNFVICQNTVIKLLCSKQRTLNVLIPIRNAKSVLC